MKYFIGLLLTFSSAFLFAQSCVVPVTLNHVVNNSSLIVEGRVVGQTAQWDANHQMIHTISEVEVFKVFKGNTGTTRVFIENLGGIVGLERIVVEPEVEIELGDYGIFTLKSSTSNLAFVTPLFMSSEGPQGFIKYSHDLKNASGLFNSYNNIQNQLYAPIQSTVGHTFVQKKKLAKPATPKAVSAGGSITSFSPTTITAGTDAVLTINGTGFGATQGSSFVGFSNADNGGANYISPIASEYISWSNTQIQVEVPTDAGTGTIIVSDGTNTLTSGSNLNVTYAIINVTSSGETEQANHVNDNGSGGYSFLAHTDFNNLTAAINDFNWALDEWRCNTDVNWATTGTTTVDVIASDGINIVRFDNGTELPGSVLGRCSSYFSGCSTAGGIEWYITELDVVFNDDYAATWHYGGGAIASNNYDFRSVALHEMGHGHGLGHVINTSQVMHYALSNGQQNASIAPGELAGGQYQMNLSFNDARCTQSVMTPNGCNSAPVAAFTVAGPAICASNGLTIAFTNTSTFSPTSYAWDMDGDNVTDHTTADVNHTYGSAGLYNVRMIATNSIGSDTATTTIYAGAGNPATVCTPTTTSAGNFDAGIVTVQFGDINHTDNSVGSTGSANQGYFDFACSNNTIVNGGQSYPFTFTLGDFNPPKCKVWIDYDNNGTFNNTNELVYNGTNNSDTHTGSITIPSSAVSGTVLRMRIISDVNTIGNACANSGFGEINDYGVLVTCQGAPVPDVATLPNGTGECSASVTAPTATDPCNSASITGTTSDPTSYSAQGTYTITWTYTGSTSSSTQTQTVIVDDVTAPVPNQTNLPDVTDNCSVSSITPPTATDNCEGTITATTNASFPITAQGTTVVTWTYDDGNGNTSTQNQNVIINDNTAPVPDNGTLATVSDQCQVSSLPVPTATDNCSGTVSATTTTTFPITSQGTTTVTWTYTDASGNTSTQTQDVNITDNAAPVADVSNLSAVNAECSVASITAPTATDNCSGTVTATTNTSFPITTQGTTTVTWTYTDAAGNTSTQTQSVNINDVTDPVADVNSLANITAECSVTSLTAPTATDNCSGSITGTHNANLPITTQGTTVVTWTYDDGNGNTSTQSQNVVINDVTGPTPAVSNLPNITGQCQVTALTTPSATDNCSGTVTAAHDATLPITTQGTTVVTWTYTDANGNTSSQTQNVILNDTQAPTIASCPQDFSQNVNAPNCMANATWTAPSVSDNCGTVTTTSSHNPGDLFPQGSTTVTYTFTDENNNQSTCSFNVFVFANLSASAATTDEINGNDGSIDVEVVGGTAPYTYDWDTDGTGDFDDPQDLNNLSGGTYTLVVEDDESCQDTLVVTVESQLGISTGSEISFQLFPNPATDELNIQLLNGQDQSWSYRLMDLNGKTLLSEERTSDSAVLNLSALAQGVYVVQVSIDQTDQTIRIVKE